MPPENKESQVQPLLFAVLQSIFFFPCLALPAHSFIYSFCQSSLFPDRSPIDVRALCLSPLAKDVLTHVIVSLPGNVSHDPQSV